MSDPAGPGRSRSAPIVAVDSTSIVFPDTWEGTVDVCFDDHRVWSFAPERQRRRVDEGRREARWPRALRPYLKGETELRLRDHVSQKDHAVLSVRFDESDGRVSFKDSSGHLLALDKWDKLVRTFDHKAENYGSDLLEDLDELFRVMHQEVGVTAYLAYGSLLGAVRTGKFIPHDTDGDIAYVSRHETPAKIVMEAFQVEHALRRLGWSTNRLTGGFMQVWRPGRTIASHIDIFTSYFSGDHFAIDRWIRGPAVKADMLPLGEVTLEGHTYPAPAHPEKILELTYGPSWLVPDPSFKFRQPKETIQRARGWMGEHRWLSGGRPSPGDVAVPPTEAVEPAPFARWTATQLAADEVVLELGCRSGVDAVCLSANGASVRGVDHMADQLRFAKARAREAGADAQFERVSLYDVRAMVSVAAEHAQHARTGRPRAIYSRGVIERLRPGGRTCAWLTARTALGHGGRMFLEISDPAKVDSLLAEAVDRGARVDLRETAPSDEDQPAHTRCVLSW